MSATKKGRRKARRGRRRLLLAAVAGAVLLTLVLVGFAARTVLGPSCDLAALKPVESGRSSYVYAADGSELGVLPAARNRTPVRSSQMSPWLRKATVAIEDRRFYHHGGVDPIGILRALVTDVREGRLAQGGSTITQELVRNLYLSRERTFQRKITEACLAVKLSHRWSKERILTAYLNEVYYGNHAYGVEAAAETYFSRPAHALSIVQAALLAGLPQAPSLYDPFVRPEEALARRDAVLHALFVQKDITRATYVAAIADRSLHLRPGSLYESLREPAVFSYLEDQLQRAYGTSTVREGGLRVYTTIDAGLQHAADAAIHGVLDRPGDPAAAVVAIDPATGAIRAMASNDPANAGSDFNLAANASRQPGSTFKTVALTAAVANGVNPYTTTYLSAPFTSGDWHVSTYDRVYHGVEPLARATYQSDNTVYARLALDLGAQRIVDMARALGVRTSTLTPDPSIALGAESVTPIEDASVYATLAAGGVYSQPFVVRRVVLAAGTPDAVTGWGVPHRERAVPDWVAATVTKVLAQNMLSGTGQAAHVPGRTDAGKTGTTDDYADAWFSGYTARLEATVWMGYSRGEVPMRDVHGIAASGPTFPAWIWRAFMTAAGRGVADMPFPAAASAPPWKPRARTTTAPTTTADAPTTVATPPPAYPATTTTP